MKTIRVTKKHIKNGKPRNGQSCPIALALDDCKLLNDSIVSCYSLYKVANNVSSQYNVRFPQEVIKFIVDFDNGQLVKPFSFKLDI